MTTPSTESARTGEPTIEVLATPDDVARIAAERIAATLTAAVGERGTAHWATTGGSSAPPIYRALASDPLRSAVPWSGVHVWYGDDRFVPSDHPLSNAGLLEDVLLARAAWSGTSGTGEQGDDVEAGGEPGLRPNALQDHPIPMTEAIARGEGPEAAAARYVDELRASGMPVVDGYPEFDLVIVGVGPDGHLLSVFPGSEAFDRTDWAMAIPAPTHVEPHVARVTLNPRVLDAARNLLVITSGAGKAEILARILEGERDPRQLPAQVARRSGATWLLDEAAAARLRR